MSIIVIVLIVVVVVIYLITQKVQKKENFDWFSDAYNDSIDVFRDFTKNDGDYNRQAVSSNYGKGLCSEVYKPNRNNYNGGTDCGRGDGVFDDWRNNGGSCPDYQRESSECGTGCRWAGGERRCV